MPLGVSGKNWENPNIDYLKFSLSLLKEQTIPVKITCAVDENLQPDRLEIVKQYAHKIVTFPKHSYFRPGGIWKKIWECWKESDCEYLKWNSYDDYIDRRSCAFQLQTIKSFNANACFCSNYNNNHGNVRKVNDGNLNFKQFIGQHPMYMGGFLLNRKAILNSGLDQYKNSWSYYFEGILYAFICKTGKIVNNPNAMFYYRDHSGTISETCREKEAWVQEAVKEVGYSFSDCKKDWDSINFNKLCEEIKRNYR